MSKEKGCKCCKRIWYEDMLDKKWGLCPNCYEYCKPLIDGLKIEYKRIADVQHRLEVAEKALELACEEIGRIEAKFGSAYIRADGYLLDYFKTNAKEMLENE